MTKGKEETKIEFAKKLPEEKRVSNEEGIKELLKIHA